MVAFTLAPGGDDDAPLGPWRTLAGARDGLRALRAAGRLVGPAVVEVADGRYPIAGPVEFGPADSHTAYVAAPGATPVFDGGVEADGWTETTHRGRRAWAVDLPDVAAGGWDLRSLFADGVRRPRARVPKFSPDAEGVHRTFRIGRLRFPERRKLFDGDHAFFPAEGDVADWPSLPDAEVVLLHYWVEARLTQPRFDPRTGLLSSARRSVFNLYESFNPLLARYYVDHLFEALDEPGEWYVDRVTGRLTYLPLDHEVLGGTRIALPRTERFLIVRGEAFNRSGAEGPAHPQEVRPVVGLRFEGLTFRHADWYPPLPELLPHDRPERTLRDRPLGAASQAAAHVPAVVSFAWASDCGFVGNVVERTGFTAVEFGPGCHGCVAAHNRLQDLGGGGVRVGGAELDGPPADRTADVEVADNVVRRTGRVFHQAVGILVQHAARCRIVHNEVGHTTYTGISVGWSWGYRDTVSRDHRIEANWVHDVCEGVLSDNGGIYLLGVQPGTVVRGNVVERVTCADYGGWGIYPDEGSAHVVIEQNLIQDTQGSAIAFHYGRENVVRDNVCRRIGDAMVGVGRGEGHVVANVFHNVFAGPSAALFAGAYAGDVRTAVRSDANVIAYPGADPAPATHPEFRTDVPHALAFADWRAAGHDRASTLVADAGLADTPDGRVAFVPGGAAERAGVRAYDWSAAGPRPRASSRNVPGPGG